MNISKPVERAHTDAPSRTVSTGVPATGPASSGSRNEAIEKTAPVDEVRLSHTSQHLAGEEPVRMDKVDEVRTAIREGRFEVSPHAVADRLISQAAELLETLARK